MSKLINTTEIPTIDVMSNYTEGKFRFITKTRLGMTCSDARDNERLMKYPETILNGYKKGALQTVQFQPHEDGHWLTVFSRVGKKVNLIDEQIMKHIKVGTINQLFYNTNLYNWNQYKAVNSKTWESWAFQMNEPKEEKEIA